MSDYNDITGGLRVPSQIPVDVKSYISSQTVLANLGTNNNLAYTYYKGLQVYCVQEKTTWEWREPRILTETGLLVNNFVYPSGISAFGINYGGKSFNFFKVMEDISTLLNSLEIDLFWKKQEVKQVKGVHDLPNLENSVNYQRNGFVGYHDAAYNSNTQQIFRKNIPGSPGVRLLEVDIYNLGIDIKDYDKIRTLSPKLVISKYTHSKKARDAEGINPNNFNAKRHKFADYKISTTNNILKPSTIPLTKRLSLIDFGQEHYFATGDEYQLTDRKNLFYLKARGLGNRTSQSRITRKDEGTYYEDKHQLRAFVYIELRIQITINGVNHISQGLRRFKMFLQTRSYKYTTKLGEDPELTPDNYVQEELNQIRYKHV